MAEFAVRNVAVNFNRMIRVCERRQQQQPGKNGLMGLKRIYLTYSILLYSGWQIPLRFLFSSEIIYWTFVLVMVTIALCPRHSLIHMPHNSHTDYTRITSYTNTPHQFPRICPYIYIPLSMASSLSISVGPTQWKRKTRNTNTTLPWAAGSIVLDGHVDKTKFNASLDIIPSELGCLECPNVPPKPKCPHSWANRTITYTHSERSDGGHHMRCACFLYLSFSVAVVPANLHFATPTTANMERRGR